jgi:uncharacterized protein (DUF4415 family)
MAKRKRPNLNQALKKVDKASDALFGKIDIDLSTLPCMRKVAKEKITANIDADVIEAIKEVAKKNHVPYASVMNDVLRKVFVDDQEAS